MEGAKVQEEFYARPGSSAVCPLIGALLVAGMATPGVLAADDDFDSPVSPRGLAPHGKLMDDLREHADELAIKQATRRKTLASSDQVAARRRSRGTYRDLSRGDAARLARDTFGPIVETRAAGPLSSGQTADEYVGDYAARIKGAAPGGKDAFVVANHPLRARNGDGRLAPVDVTLTGSASGGWGAKNPLEPYRIGSSSREGVRFDGGFAVAPVGDAVEGSVAGQAVFYPDTQTDTDTLMKPLLNGTELLWQLRSAMSPEQLSLSVSLPDGAGMTEPSKDGVRIVRDGETVALIGRVAAADANGTPVKTTTKVSGGQIVIGVDHRDADVAYPIIVDPPVTAGFYFPYQGADAFDYWGTYNYGRFDVWGGGGNWGNGLNIVSDNYPNEYVSFNAGDRAGMYYTAPGNAHIYRMYNTLSRNITGESLAVCMIVGIANPAINSWEGAYGVTYGEGCGPFGAYSWTVQVPGNGGTPGNNFVFGAYRYSGTPTAFWQYFADAEISMVDPDNPGISSFGVPPGWTNATHGEAVNVLAGDYSTGVKSIDVVGPAGWSGSGGYVNPNCAYGPCSKQYSLSLPLTSMAEGVQNVSVTASDPAGNPTLAPWTKTISIDRTAPDPADLTGFLIDAEGILTSTVDYTLTAISTDALSHPLKAEVKLDGQVVDTFDCPDEPACIADLTFTPTSAQLGDHVVAVAVTDRAGNVSTTAPIAVNIGDDITPDSDNGPTADGTTPLGPVDTTGQADGDDPRGWCGPGSLNPDEPCSDDVPDSDADAAVRAEADLDQDAETPLIVGDPSEFVPEGDGMTAARGTSLRIRGKGWGVADNKAADRFFTVPAPNGATGTALQDLGVKRVRFVTPWDTVLRARSGHDWPNKKGGDCGSADEVTVPQSKGDVHKLDRWMHAALKRGYEPMLSFEHTSGADGARRRCAKPNVPDYTAAVTAVMKRFRKFYRGKGTPRVFTAWNEPNFREQPVSDDGKLAGQYFTALRRLCSRRDLPWNCTVGAGDFAIGFFGNLRQYVEDYRDGIPNRSGNGPVAWAIHPYGLGWNNFTLADAQAEYRQIKKLLIGDHGTAKMWFTEQGGYYWPQTNQATGLLLSPDDAQVRSLCLLVRLARSNSEVTRFYQYMLIGGGNPMIDSGLLHLPNGQTARAAYNAYRYFTAGVGSNTCPAS